MGEISGHGHPIGALSRLRSLNYDITRLAKCPLEKHTSSHWPVETLCILSVAIILSNKWISVFVQTGRVFTNSVTYKQFNIICYILTTLWGYYLHSPLLN